MFFKKQTVPATNETVQVDAVQTWEVRWQSLHGDILKNEKPEVAVFTSEQQAKEFAESLHNAFKLLRYSGSIYGKLTAVQCFKSPIY